MHIIHALKALYLAHYFRLRLHQFGGSKLRHPESKPTHGLIVRAIQVYYRQDAEPLFTVQYRTTLISRDLLEWALWSAAYSAVSAGESCLLNVNRLMPTSLKPESSTPAVITSSVLHR